MNYPNIEWAKSERGQISRWIISVSVFCVEMGFGDIKAGPGKWFAVTSLGKDYEEALSNLEFSIGKHQQEITQFLKEKR